MALNNTTAMGGLHSRHILLNHTLNKVMDILSQDMVNLHQVLATVNLHRNSTIKVRKATVTDLATRTPSTATTIHHPNSNIITTFSPMAILVRHCLNYGESANEVKGPAPNMPNPQNSRPGHAPPPPPTAPQTFGGGAPQGYQFQYSNCTGKRKALLIGINYFGQRGQLRGCINDVKNMSTYLNQNFGYAREDMVILTDDQQNPMSQPTKANLLRAMHWLVKDARQNDSLFFHYSGHGGQTPDLDGDEEDGYDEVIYPVDFRTQGHIVDDELHRIMVKTLPPGVRLTAIFDSCHSGSALDLPYIYSTQGVLKEPNLAKEAGQGSALDRFINTHVVILAAWLPQRWASSRRPLLETVSMSETSKRRPALQMSSCGLEAKTHRPAKTPTSLVKLPEQ